MRVYLQTKERLSKEGVGTVRANCPIEEVYTKYRGIYIQLGPRYVRMYRPGTLLQKLAANFIKYEQVTLVMKLSSFTGGIIAIKNEKTLHM